MYAYVYICTYNAYVSYSFAGCLHAFHSPSSTQPQQNMSVAKTQPKCVRDERKDTCGATLRASDCITSMCAVCYVVRCVDVFFLRFRRVSACFVDVVAPRRAVDDVSSRLAACSTFIHICTVRARFLRQSHNVVRSSHNHKTYYLDIWLKHIIWLYGILAKLWRIEIHSMTDRGIPRISSTHKSN